LLQKGITVCTAANEQLRYSGESQVALRHFCLGNWTYSKRSYILFNLWHLQW